MKTEEFLTRLRETPRDWLLTPASSIRNAAGLCPIEAVTGVLGAFNNGPRILGVSRSWVSRVANAADYGTRTYRRLWRKRLLEACGLTE